MKATFNMNITHPAHGGPSGPCLMIVFGATGDLTKRLLLPSLYNLAQTKLLPEKFAILGFSFDKIDTGAFREHVGKSLAEFLPAPPDPAIADWLKERSYYATGNFDDAASFAQLKSEIEKLEGEQATEGNRLFYLAVAPRFIAGIARQLSAAGLSAEEDGKWRRLIVEKPFGHDLPSAKVLNKDLAASFEESQIYRIDHYLGKETVQDITVLRFSNSVLEPVWNRANIDSVQLTATETVGVERRGGYYESAGALRDMVPNHLAQLLSLTAMEPPSSFDAENMRAKAVEAMQAIQPVAPGDVSKIAVRGQYGAGWIGGADVPAYRDEEGVAPDSKTETYAAMKVTIDNWRWAGVPFYLRTGKRLGTALTEVVVRFRHPPLALFRDTPIESLETNQLLIRIQPDSGISLRFGVKAPGPVTTVEPAVMNFDFSSSSTFAHGTGYERLLHDCMLGDATLFQRADMVEAGWSMVQTVLESWGSSPPSDFPNYASGSWGPQAADDLLARDGRQWRKLD